jgi:hypothetical protein
MHRTVSPLHDADARLLVRIIFAYRFELVVEVLVQPCVQYLIAKRMEIRVPFWVAEVCEARHDPVCALPFVLDTPAARDAA